QLFVETPDLHSQPFIPHELGAPDFFYGQTANIAFISMKDSLVSFTGPTLEAAPFYQFTTDARVRRVAYQVVDSRGYASSGYLCLRDNAVTECPPYVPRGSAPTTEKLSALESKLVLVEVYPHYEWKLLGIREPAQFGLSNSTLLETFEL